MTSIAELGIRINSDEATQAADDLDKLALSGGKAEKATLSLAQSADKAEESMQGLGAQTKTTEKSTEGLTRQTEKLGMSAKQTSAALRGVPAQFTDIVTSIQAGQAPLTVLLQQGGQLKDMFGGVGPAAKALGGYVAGLINPFTLAAAAAAGLGFAYYKGAEESARYREALILTGNAAGTTADSLATMASRIGETVGTTSKAADVLAQMAGSGKIASSSFEEVATAALQMQESTGRAVAETVAEFVKIGKDPVAAAKELNDQYGFLTASVYAQIASLKEQGREQEAVKLLTDIYADTVQNRSKQVVENLNLWRRAWNGVKSATSEALSGLASVGRESTMTEQLADAESRLAQMTAGGRDAAKEDPFRYEAATKEIARLKIALQAGALNAATEGLRGQNQKEAIAGIDLINKEAGAAATNVEKLNDRLSALDKARTKNITNDSWSSDEQAKYEKAAAALRKQIADDQAKAAKLPNSAVDLTAFNDAQNKLKLIVSEYQNSQRVLDAAQKSGLLSQKDYSEQSAALIEQEKGRIAAAYQAEISALEAAKGKKSTSADQRIALDQKIADARANMVKAEQDADTKLSILSANETGRIKKQTAAVQSYVDALNDQLSTTQKQLELSVAGVGMGDEARRRLQEDIKIQQEYQDKLDKLQAQKNKNQIDDSVYKQETAAVRQALAQRLDMQRDYYKAVEAEQTNWLNGATSAYETYLEQVKNVAGQVGSAFTKAFTGLEDVLVSFVTTGKASFKDFADTIIAEIARIAVKSQVMPVILGALGLTGSAGAAASGLGGSAGSAGSSGIGLADLANYGTSAYKFLSGAGGNLYSAYQSGGLSGVYDYGSSAVGGMFSSGSGSTAAGYANVSNFSAGAGGSVNGIMGSGVSGLGAAGYGIGGALYGYGQSGLKGAVAGGLGSAGGAIAGGASAIALGAAAGSIVPVIGTIIGAALGGLLGGSLFGGKWQTKDQGIQLGVEDGDLSAQQFEFQKKKGGLFSSNKKRTRLSALDPEMQASLDATYDATEGAVLGLFDRLNVTLDDGVLDGLNVAATKISTKDKTAEQIQEEVTKWFSSTAESMVSAINSATGAGLDGYNIEALTAFVQNLESVNSVMTNLNVGLFDVSVAGGKMAEQLSAMAGGFDALSTRVNTYYANFFSETEKADDTLEAVNKQFADLNITLPETRKGYRDVIEALDVTTEAGRSMFVTLTGLAGNAAAAYSILEQRASEAQQAAAAVAQAIIDALKGAATGAGDAVKRAVAAEQKAATDAYNARTASINDMLSTATSGVQSLTGVSNDLGAALKQLRGDSDETVKALRSQAQATLQSALKTARSGGSLAGFTGLNDALDTLGNNTTGQYGSKVDFQRDQGRTANVIAELDRINGKQLTTAEQTVKTLQDQLEQGKQAYDAQMATFDQQLSFAQAQLDALNGIDTSVKTVTEAVAAMNSSVVAALSVMDDAAAKANTPENNAALVESIYKVVLGRGSDAEGKAHWTGLLQSGAMTYGQIAATLAASGVNHEGEGSAGQASAKKYLEQYVSAAYRSVLKREVDPEGLDAWVRQIVSGAMRPDQLTAALIGSQEYAQKKAAGVPGFASGGDFGGGLRLVGENGPELEVTGPSRIYNASQTAAMLNGNNNASVVAELRVLRAELENIKANTQASAQHSSKAARILERVTQGGEAMQVTESV
jgi:lambda family phage tail tape measure protein